MMERQLYRWAQEVKRRLARLDISISKVSYYIPRLGQRRKFAIYAQAEGTTSNSNFFGTPYENALRIRLLDLAYEAAGSQKAMFGTDEAVLDIRLSLSPEFSAGEPFNETEERAESYDVTVNNDVQLIPFKTPVRQVSVISSNSTFGEYHRLYGVTHILKHGFHHISPDIVSVKALELIGRLPGIPSVLEIGGGVGVAAVAAERLGIRDYTFLDSSPVVCQYLRRRFPWTTVIDGDARQFRFLRDYDVVLIGIPYELNPAFMERSGEALAEHAGIAVWQSGCMAFFEWEHDWLMGRTSMHAWPWYRPEQTVPHHFRNICEGNMDWQRFIMASNHENASVFSDVRLNMKHRGLLTPVCSSLSC